MQSIFPTRGCIIRVEQESGKSGFYEMNPSIGKSTDSPVLLLGASVSESDILQPRTTLDDLQVIYSFGKAFGQVQITGVVLLGNAKAGNGAGLAAVVRYFQTHRSATSKQPVQLSLPGQVAYSIFLNALAIGQVDVNFNIQHFMIGAIPIEKNS